MQEATFFGAGWPALVRRQPRDLASVVDQGPRQTEKEQNKKKLIVLNLCEHGMKKRKCKDCAAPAFCEHGKRKPNCKDCGGSRFCEHGKIKYNGRECGGSAICEHGKWKFIGKDCGGAALCEHGKYKRFCARSVGDLVYASTASTSNFAKKTAGGLTIVWLQ